MMENPFARIVRRGFQAMVEAMQEELGQMAQQLVQGMLTPDTLGALMGMMQRSLGAMGFDMGKFAGMVGQQPGFDASGRIDRVGGAHGHKGHDAVDAALEMIGIVRSLGTA